MQYRDLNIGNSIFQGFNDKNGLMICGYEWGFSKKDKKKLDSGQLITPTNEDIEYTFANKASYWGEVANDWRYDNVIKKWFELWDFPLNSSGLGGSLEKSIIQTNWANTQSHSIDKNGIDKFLHNEHIENFIYHVETLQPNVILFMGSKLADYLQKPMVLPKFENIMGSITTPFKIMQKDFSGTKFKIKFQSFEKCEIVGFPHPSGSRGISYDYIKLYKPEMGNILSNYIQRRGFK